MFFGKKKPELTGAGRVIGYRYSATGVFEYVFYRKHEKLCTVSGIVAPSSPVRIDGYGLKWRSGFDMDCTVYPGLTRYVYDAVSSRQAAGLVYMDGGTYEIAGSVTVRCDGEMYVFFRNNEVIARMNRYKGQDTWVPELAGYDCEPYFEVLFEKDADDQLKLLIFSFPMLRFGF